MVGRRGRRPYDGLDAQTLPSDPALRSGRPSCLLSRKTSVGNTGQTCVCCQARAGASALERQPGTHWGESRGGSTVPLWRSFFFPLFLFLTLRKRNRALPAQGARPHPQGACRIRRAAEPPTAAQARTPPIPPRGRNISFPLRLSSKTSDPPPSVLWILTRSSPQSAPATNSPLTFLLPVDTIRLNHFN